MAIAHVDQWAGTDVRLADVERAISLLRERDANDEDGPDLRTSVLTHVVWAPRRWRTAVEEVMAGLAERHPSRAIVLFPEPESARDALDAEVALESYDVKGLCRHVAAEVIRIHLHGPRASAPASVVSPLLVTDLPVFLRWRGQPPFGTPPFEQLLGVTDRVIVDSTEWDELPAAYAQLGRCFDRAAVSDIAWSRTLRWRREVAALWPGIAEVRRVRVRAPRALGLLLAGWLRARLRRDLEVVLEAHDLLSEIDLDGRPVEPPPGEAKTPSDLLSDELEVYGRDRVYEQAALAAVAFGANGVTAAR
ncbi:MAG: glucose-6-phosphate dehydrogenase assembly protein OpcA [Gaiellaceae bacterium]